MYLQSDLWLSTIDFAVCFKHELKQEPLMSQFHSVYAIGYKQERLASTLTPDFRQSSLAQRIRPEDKPVFGQLLDLFARQHLGMALVDRYSRKDVALATTHYPPRAGESIDWGGRLYDSDGFEHALAILGGIEVVTAQSFTYCVWDRRTGRCLREEASDLTLGNTPMTPEQRENRTALAEQAFSTMKSCGPEVDAGQPRVRPGQTG